MAREGKRRDTRGAGREDYEGNMSKGGERDEGEKEKEEEKEAEKEEEEEEK